MRNNNKIFFAAVLAVALIGLAVVGPLGAKPAAAANSLPVATDDAYSTPANTLLNVASPGVLANDTDVESDPLTASKYSDPVHGTAAVNADGSFVYTPVAGYDGPDSFKYRVSDGSPEAANDMAREAATALRASEKNLHAVVIDAEHRFLYAATFYGSPATSIVKFDLTTFTQVDSIVFDGPRPQFENAVIDDVNGFAYFESYGDGIFKIRLSDFTIAGSLSAAELGDLTSGYSCRPSLDVSAGYGYWCTQTSVVKVDLASFTVSASYALPDLDRNWGEYITATGIDTVSNPHQLYVAAWYRKDGIRAKLTKFDLSTFTPTSTIDLGADLSVGQVLIDSQRGVGVLAAQRSSAYGHPLAYAIDLASFTVSGGPLDLGLGGYIYHGSALDQAGGYGYFTVMGQSYMGQSAVVKVRLSPFALAGSFITSSDVDTQLTGLAYEPATNYLYVTGSTTPSRVIKLNAADMSRLATTVTPWGESGNDIAVDGPGGFAYVSAESSIDKISLADMSVVGRLSMKTAPFNAGTKVFTGVVDPAQGYGYFWYRDETNPSAIGSGLVKVRLLDMTVAAVRSLTAYNAHPGAGSYSLIDTANGRAYFPGYVTGYGPPRIFIVDLATFNVSYRDIPGTSISGMAIDSAGGYLYYSTSTLPARVVKLRLSDFAQLASVTLGAREGYARTVAVDPAGGSLFTSASYDNFNRNENKVVKIDLATFTEVASVPMASGEWRLNHSFIAGGNVYFSVNGYEARKLAKFRMSDLTRLDTLTFASPSISEIHGLVYDSTSGRAYLSTDNNYGRAEVVKVRLTPSPQLLGTVNLTVVSPVPPVTIDGGSAVCEANPDGSVSCAIVGANGGSFTVVLPAGVQPVPPATSIGVTVVDDSQRPRIKIDAGLPVGTTKTVEMPKGTLGQHVCVKDVAGAEFTAAPGMCEGAGGGVQVNLPAAGSGEVISIGSGTPDGAHDVTVALSADGQKVTVSGLLHSVIEFMPDTDGDGVLDERDDCSALTGTSEFRGCPAAVDASFERHTVQAGTKPGSTKVGIAGAGVSLFSQELGACASNIGNSPKDYAAILAGCVPVRVGQTDSDGNVRLGLSAGKWLLLSADPQTGVVAGSEVGMVQAGNLARKYLQVIVTADGTSVSGKTTVRTGSQLLVIEPEYMVWSDTQAYYPFIFESLGDWGVEVSVTPPEGFVADASALSDVVADDYKALQFTLVDQGSCWSCGVSAEVQVTHGGKTEKWGAKIAFALEEKFAKSKNLDKAGLWVMKKEAKQLEKAKDQDAKKSSKLSAGGSLWKEVAAAAAELRLKQPVLQLAREVARANYVAVPEWGIKGLQNARSLKSGMTLDLSSLLAWLNR